MTNEEPTAPHIIKFVPYHGPWCQICTEQTLADVRMEWWNGEIERVDMILLLCGPHALDASQEAKRVLGFKQIGNG